MRVCPFCGREAQMDNRYCEHCGQPLEGVASAAPHDGPMFGGDVNVAGRAGADGDRSWPPHLDGDGDPSEAALAGAGGTRMQPNLTLSTGGPEGRLLMLTQGVNPQVEGELVLDGSNVTIGRAPSCSVSLPDDHLVSRLHAMLHYNGQHYILSDLGSSNGTQVNGMQIGSPTVLEEGDRITVGTRALVFTTTIAEAQAREQPPTQEQATEAPVPPAGQVAADWGSSGPPTWLAAPEPTAEEDEAGGAVALVQGAMRDDEAAPVSAAAPDPAPAPLSEPAPTPEPQGPAAWEDLSQPRAPAWQSGSAVDPAQWHATGPGFVAPAVQMAPATGDLDQMRVRLVEMSTLLSQVTEGTRQQNKWLRTELRQLAQQISATLAELEVTTTGGDGAAATGTPHELALADLISIAEQAADDPHHVNSLLALAGRAGEVAAALRVEQQLIGEVRRLRDRLAELARTDGW